MTIVESIKEVLASYKQGLTSRDIYSKIIEKSLYTFGAADPVGVVNSQIRRRCVGLDFPTSYPDKQFVIIGYDGKRPKYALIGNETENKPGNVSQRKESNSDRLPEEIIVSLTFTGHDMLSSQEHFKNHVKNARISPNLL